MILQRPNFFKQSLFAELITLAPAILLFIYAGTSSSQILPNGEIDNDPMRAGWALLFLSPIFFLILVMFFYISSRLLFSLDKLNFINHEIIVLVAAAFLSGLIAYDSFKFFLTFAIVFSLWLSTGTVGWHYVERKRYNKVKNSVPLARTPQ